MDSRAVGGEITTGDTTWSLAHTTGGYQTNPIWIKPVWKSWGNEAKNEAKLGGGLEGGPDRGG